MSCPAGAVYVGRFQPPHAAHVGSVRYALKHAPRVLVLVGSANLARSVHNPWSASERTGMFRAALRDGGADVRRVTFRPLPDHFDAERWAAGVREQAAAVFGPAAALALVGFEKDASSAYLRWFPGWSRLNVSQTPGLNATDLRRALFEGQPLPARVPAAVRAFLSAFVRHARLRPAAGRVAGGGGGPRRPAPRPPFDRGTLAVADRGEGGPAHPARSHRARAVGVAWLAAAAG